MKLIWILSKIIWASGAHLSSILKSFEFPGLNWSQGKIIRVWELNNSFEFPKIGTQRNSKMVIIWVPGAHLSSEFLTWVSFFNSLWRWIVRVTVEFSNSDYFSLGNLTNSDSSESKQNLPRRTHNRLTSKIIDRLSEK